MTTTALVKINPQEDAEIKSYHDEALKILEFAEKRVISSVEGLKLATDDLSVIANMKKAIEGKRKEYVQPLQEHVKDVNNAFKVFMEPIEQADRLTRVKILDYQREQERIRQEQEEINRKRMEAAEAEMRLKGELTESVNLVEVSEEAPKKIHTGMGTVGQRMIRKYRVVDFALLPDQYKIENSALLNKVVKAGIPSIPGIEIYEEPIITVTSKKEG